MTTSSHRTRGNEVVKRETIKGPESASRTLYSLMDRLSRWISPVRIIVGGPGVLDIVLGLELFEALHPGIIDILGIGDELRRRSVGGRHFDVEDGLMV